MTTRELKCRDIAGVFAEYEIINPPFALQNHFTYQIEFIEQQKAQVKVKLAKNEELFRRLLGESSIFE